MRFYQVEVKSNNNPYDVENLTRDKERELNNKTCKVTMECSEETYLEKGLAFVSGINPIVISACVLNDKSEVKDLVKTLLKKMEVKFTALIVKEISMSIFFSDLMSADRGGRIEDDWSFACSLGLDDFFNQGRHSNSYSDRIVEEKKTVSDLKKDAEDNFLGLQYTNELNRILKGKTQKKFIGHPAHYIIVSKNGDHRRIMTRDMIAALYKKGRLPSKRYTIVDICDRDCNTSFLEKMYKVNEGATVMLKVNAEDVENDGFKRRGLDIDDICKIVKENCSKVLTIFSVDSGSQKLKDKIMNALLGITVVDISEDIYHKDSAVKLITNFAERDGLTVSEDFIEKIKNSERTYEFDDILGIYNKWRHEYLGTKVFVEYKKFVTHEVEKTDDIKSDAYKELQEMIGLTGAKKLIDDAINFFKLQKEYRLRGIEFKRPSMHMVFTGSPGTAKTSVARLVARILKDNGILSVGNLIEVGRADIIGQYVGQTAPLVKETFAKAKGSVLFIDEAYSLVDDRKGLYGDEAINTIVQEMENHRDDMIVIFAGYQKEMKEFLERNPGLNSRIAFHIPFEDYSSEELLDITKLIAKNTGFSIDGKADGKLLKIFDDVRSDESFGNGRFARNLIEKAKMHQADRLIKQDLQFVSDKEMTTLIAEDFDMPEVAQPKVRLGFTV
ncbi:MAG: AAA family ATPase [Clostridia bacterium]|nr:AAA family ATPase [Clostridia bacterium]